MTRLYEDGFGLDYFDGLGFVADALSGDGAGEGGCGALGLEIFEVVALFEEGFGDQLQVSVGIHGDV